MIFLLFGVMLYFFGEKMELPGEIGRYAAHLCAYLFGYLYKDTCPYRPDPWVVYKFIGR